jgi:hypothetical protein
MLSPSSARKRALQAVLLLLLAVFSTGSGTFNVFISAYKSSADVDPCSLSVNSSC